MRARLQNIRATSSRTRTWAPCSSRRAARTRPLAICRRAVAARPGHPAARNSLGTALLASGASAEAIDVSPGRAAVARFLPRGYNLGMALPAAGRPAPTIARFEVGAGANPAGRGRTERSGQRPRDDGTNAGSAAGRWSVRSR